MQMSRCTVKYSNPIRLCRNKILSSKAHSNVFGCGLYLTSNRTCGKQFHFWMNISKQNYRIWHNTNVHLSFQLIANNSLFGLDFKLTASSAHISLKTTLTKPSLWQLTKVFWHEMNQQNWNLIWTGLHYVPNNMSRQSRVKVMQTGHRDYAIRIQRSVNKIVLRVIQYVKDHLTWRWCKEVTEVMWFEFGNDIFWSREY